MIRTLLLTILMAGILATPAMAQIKTPRPSPGAKLTQTVGLTEIMVEYSRPGVKGRTIFAKDGLVPFGKVWRTGANLATKVTFGDDVTVAGKKLAKGSYALLTKPGAKEWAFHFYTYEKAGWSSYLEAEPKIIVTAKPEKVTEKVESFTIDIGHLEMDGAHLMLTWENTRVRVPIKVEVKDRVMKNIEQVMAGPSGNDYYQAATFMHESGGDLNQALTYIQKATSSDDPKYWHLRRESLILADLGKKKEAIAAAEKSLAKAKEAGNEDYVRLNENAIAEWKK